MNYIAHRDEEREQLLLEHLEGTAKRAQYFAGKFGKEDWGYCCGLLHDIGKYSKKFQKKMQGENELRVDHSTAGARLCWELKGLYPIMEFCIAGHHAGLPDRGSDLDTGSLPTLMGRRKKKIEDYQAYKNEVQVPALKTCPIDVQNTSTPEYSISFFIRMLYSCLVDADFLDTEYFMKQGITERQGGETMSELLEHLEKYIADWLKNEDTDSVNGRRTEILRHCLEAGSNAKGLFRLTVPTGGGKTITSLAFALKHAVEHNMDRIIYVIPYTSIIEQNAKIFRNILGENNVLENHYNVDYEGSEDFKSMQLASENWDKPIVVTTNVQFFESLYANKSSKCRKLHNIANSVIIFDEVQMLPNDYLKPCIAALEELINSYRVTAVLCTATQPALKQFFQTNRAATELCPRMEEQFRFFKRVDYCNAGILSQDELSERLLEEKQALCIVNTRKRAQSLYENLEGDGVYHLSTSMYPKHRKRILNQITERLKSGKRCVLISTSLVEAGIDLDFQTVYRQLAGLDSIAQAAGRCNREGKYSANESKVFIFQFAEKENVPGQRQQIDVSESLLKDNCEIADLKTISRYFEMLYHIKGESLDKKKILEEFENGQCNFAKVGKEFKIIEENTKTIFIGQTEEAKAILEELKFQGFTRSNMRKAGQFCVNVYEKEWDKLYSAGMVRVISEDAQDFYELTDLEQYTEGMGLNLAIEIGMSVFIE